MEFTYQHVITWFVYKTSPTHSDFGQDKVERNTATVKILVFPPTNSQVQKYYYCFVKFVKVSLWVQSGCGKWEDGEGNKTVWNLNAYIQLTNYRYIRTRDCTYLPSTSIQCYLLQSDAAPSWYYNRKTTPPSQKTTIIDKIFNTLDIFFFFFFFPFIKFSY